MAKQGTLSILLIFFIISTGVIGGLYINEYSKNQRMEESFENFNYITINNHFEFSVYYINESSFYFGSIKTESIRIQINLKDIMALVQKNRPSTPINYCITEQIEEIAFFIKEECNKAIYPRAGRYASEFELARTLLHFSGNIPYAKDEDTKNTSNYVNYPLETLFDAQGDCEDHAILFSTLCKAVGIEVLLIVGKVSDGEIEKVGHMASAVYLESDNIYLGEDKYEYRGKEYYICETTSQHSNIGDNPWEKSNWTNEWKIY